MRVLLVTLLLALPAAALAQVSFGPEFQVNSYSFRDQRLPDVASDQQGRFVVVWWRESEFYGGEGIFGQRFDAGARPLGAEFRVSADSSGAQQSAPSVAVAGDGSFVVAWAGDFPDPDRAIWARRFNAAGTPFQAPFRVSTSTDALPDAPDLSMDASGNFVVVWTDDDGSASGVVGRRFDAGGNPRGAVFPVNTYTTGSQGGASVAMAPGGGFMVTWASNGQLGDSWEMWARRYDAQGVPQASEFHLNTHTTGLQFNPRVAADGAGNFVVVWEDLDRGLIAIRRFDAGGPPVGVEFAVTVTPPYFYPINAKVAVELNGGFTVVWGDDRLLAQRFSAANVPGPVQLVDRPLGIDQDPAVAALGTGRAFVATWWAWDDSGAPNGIFARRYADVGPFALEVDATPGPAANGNGVLEPSETVVVAPRWFNSNAAAQAATGQATFDGPGAASLYTITDAAANYGTLPAGGSATCATTADCYAVRLNAGTRPGVHWDARLLESIATGTQIPSAGWTLHVGESFGDVPRSSPYYRFVETLLHRGVTAGCQNGTVYCPGAAATREQMAVFVLAAREPHWFRPFHCDAGQEDFSDVPAASPFCSWIEELANRGVVGGCAQGFFCPHDAVTREQMAVFVLRTLDPALDPPACTTPVFADVPASSAFCRWVEELVRRGIATGCGGGNYCPAAAVTREQMAVFLTATFGLTLYGS